MSDNNFALSSLAFTFVDFSTSSSSILPVTTTDSFSSNSRRTRTAVATDNADSSTTASASDSSTPITSAASSAPTSSTVLATDTTVQAAAATSIPSSTSASTPTTLPAVSHHNGVSSGAIAAAVIVPLIVIAAAIVGFLLYRRRNRNGRGAAQQEKDDFDAGGISEKQPAYAHSVATQADYQHDHEAGLFSPATARTEQKEQYRRQQDRAAAYNALSPTTPAAYRPTSRVTDRPSMSTIRTYASSIHPHPPVLPPVDTTFSFARSLSTEALGQIATPPPAATTALRRGDSASSTSSDGRDPFATPSPSSAHTRSPSSASYMPHQSCTETPAFTLRRASSPISPHSPTLPRSSTTSNHHLSRPEPAARAGSNNSANTFSSLHPSITPSTAAEFDEDDFEDAEIMEPSVAEAVVVRRPQLGERHRASVIDLNGTFTGSGKRNGSGSSGGSQNVFRSQSSGIGEAL